MGRLLTCRFLLRRHARTPAEFEIVVAQEMQREKEQGGGEGFAASAWRARCTASKEMVLFDQPASDICSKGTKALTFSSRRGRNWP
jgi:hypothetical protein